MAQSHGLHTDIQSASVGDQLAHHGHRLWWTVYTLDRKLSSLMGIPNGTLDDHISAPVPQISEDDIHTSALAIHIKISQLLGSIAISMSFAMIASSSKLTSTSCLWAKGNRQGQFHVNHTKRPERNY